MSDHDSELLNTLDDLRLEYTAYIHDVFKEDEFRRVENTVKELRESKDIARSHVAGIHKIYAHLANKRPPLSDIADQYDLSERAVQNGVKQIQEKAGIDFDMRGAPEKLREHAVQEAQELFDNHIMDKTLAAEEVARRYRISDNWVLQQLQGESRSKYAKRGLTAQVEDLLNRRPQTNKELVDRIGLPRTAQRYTRYLDTDKIHTAGHRVYVWYMTADEEAATAYDAVLQATHQAKETDWSTVLQNTAERLEQEDWLPVNQDAWISERKDMYQNLQERYEDNPQYVAALQNRITGITDFLVSYEGDTRFRARDVAQYLGADQDSEVREVGKALALLEDDAGVPVSSGSPRNYTADSYTDADVFLAGTAIDWIEKEQ